MFLKQELYARWDDVLCVELGDANQRLQLLQNKLVLFYTIYLGLSPLRFKFRSARRKKVLVRTSLQLD
jgi:hypothetical protein